MNVTQYRAAGLDLAQRRLGQEGGVRRGAAGSWPIARAYWLDTIGEFHPTIDKGKPENLVSLCIDGIKKTGPATFELRRRELIPRRDPKILILEPDPGR